MDRPKSSIYKGETYDKQQWCIKANTRPAASSGVENWLRCFDAWTLKNKLPPAVQPKTKLYEATLYVD